PIQRSGRAVRLPEVDAGRALGRIGNQKLAVGGDSHIKGQVEMPTVIVDDAPLNRPVRIELGQLGTRTTIGQLITAPDVDVAVRINHDRAAPVHESWQRIRRPPDSQEVAVRVEASYPG